MLTEEGTFLQAVRSPGSCPLGALGIAGGRLSVSDGASRVHLFAIEHPHSPAAAAAAGTAAAPAPLSAAAAGPAAAVATAQVARAA